MSAISVFSGFAKSHLFNTLLPVGYSDECFPAGEVIISKCKGGTKVMPVSGCSIRGQIRIVVDWMSPIVDSQLIGAVSEAIIADLSGDSSGNPLPLFVCRATREMSEIAGFDFAIFIGDDDTDWSILDQYVADNPTTELVTM